MNGLLTLVTPATSYPVLTAELKGHLRILHSDDDAIIEGYIASACEYVEAASGHAVLSQTWKYSVSCAPTERLCLPKYPVLAFTAIDYYDADNAAQSATVGNFTLYDSGMDAWIQPNQNIDWPAVYSRPDALSVTFTVGGAMGTYPSLRQAALMIAADWYENPKVTTENGTKEVPYGATQLINLNRRNWIAA